MAIRCEGVKVVGGKAEGVWPPEDRVPGEDLSGFGLKLFGEAIVADAVQRLWRDICWNCHAGGLVEDPQRINETGQDVFAFIHRAGLATRDEAPASIVAQALLQGERALELFSVH